MIMTYENFIIRCFWFLTAILVFLGVIIAREHDDFTRSLTLSIDLVFFGFCLATIFKRKYDLRVIKIVSITLVVLFFLVFSYVINNNRDYDSEYFFLQSLKVFFYLIFLAAAMNYRVVDGYKAYVYFNIFLVLMLLKYIFLYFVLGEVRPVFIVENNFELQAVLLMYSFIYFQKSPHLSIRLTLYLLILFSGSRSALGCLIFVEFILAFKKIDYKFIFLLTLTMVLVLAAYQVFVDRLNGSSVEDIDRVRFLYGFIYEVNNSFSLANYLFGNKTYAPLSNETCSSFSFYQGFFNRDKTFCFSAIFHSYNLRVLFDYGLLGSILIFYLFYSYLKVAKTPSRLIFIIIGVAFLNGMSVSALNNIYYIIPFFLIINYYYFKGENE